MKLLSSSAFLLALLGSACVHGATTEASGLTLTFETGAQTGAVMVSLFDSQGTYASGAPIRQARVDVAAGERTTRFAGLPAGTYAVRAFHDVNGNGRMDKNPFGRPIEPFAFSNNAPPSMGPASWALARLSVQGATTQTITFR